MALTDSQLQTLATALSTSTDQTVIDALAIGNNVGLTEWCNAQASPNWYVWRTSMPVSEMRDQHFDWAEVVSSLTTNGLLSLQVLTDTESVNPSKASIRAAFAQIFAGPNLVNTRTALTAAAKKLATNCQKIFSTGTGSEADPATYTVESVSIDDVRAAVRAIG